MKLPGMPASNSRTFNLAKENVLKARALHAATSATVAALLPVEPADYLENEKAALAYEEACLAIEAAHELGGLAAMVRLTEDKLIDAALLELAKLKGKTMVDSGLSANLPAMRKNVVARAKMVDLFLGLKL